MDHMDRNRFGAARQMADDSRFRDASALMLQWHAGALTIELEAFRLWALAMLQPRLRFDGAMWCLYADGEARDAAGSAHRWGLSEEAAEQFGRFWRQVLAREPASGVVNVCLLDAQWQDDAHAATREYGARHGFVQWLSAHVVDADSPMRQSVTLARRAPADRFSADEAEGLALLAPHMMQAYATRRRLFLDGAQGARPRGAGVAAAMVDATGAVHDQQPRFLSMMRREWSDWPGQTLPDALLELVARRAGTRWRFLGQQVAADFVPVDRRYLVTARQRSQADVLTAREAQVAQRYAEGMSFREIAEALQLAPATVRSHLRNIFGKLQVRNKTQLAAALRRARD